MDTTRVELRPSLGTYAGLFVITMATLMYEILLTRIFSVTMWYHFAFMAVSVALFGLTLGALIVYLMPERFSQEKTRQRLWQASLLFSVTLVLSFLTQLVIPFQADWSLLGVYSVAFIYLIISIPFVFSGIAVSLTLTRFPSRVNRLYAVDLVGAALGTVALIWLLDWTNDAPSAVIAVAAFVAIGAGFFAKDAGSNRVLLLAAVTALLLGGFATVNAISAQNDDPILRVVWTKGGKEAGPTIHETWNTFSRLRVYGNADRPSKPLGWGLSSKADSSPPVRQLLLDIDSSAVTVLTHYEGNNDDVAYLRYDVTNMAHYLRSDADVFVVGSGGGRDVLTALVFDQESVTAVELNDDIIKLVNGRFGDFTGHLDQQPGVRFIRDEARSYLARSSERFDIIQMSLIDTWAATAAGAFSLSENSLYTVEAWENFIEHLSPRGILSVSRWYVDDQPMSAYRLTSLAAEALRRGGVEDTEAHLMFVKSRGTSFQPSVGTILVSNEPFSDQDINTIMREAAELDFEVVLAPEGRGSKPIFARIASAQDPTSIPLGIPVDISAPTDDRPFFFQMVRFQDVFNSSLYAGGGNDLFITRPVLTLFSLSVAVLALTALFIVLPLVLTTTRAALRGMLPFIVFFGAIGLGFLLLEIAQMQRLIIFLGHPTYALSVVLFSLLLFSGLGSLATERLVNPMSNARLSATVLLPLVGLLTVLLVFGFLTPAAIDWFEAETTPVRIGTAVAILAPMGFLMGMPFPLGMRVASLDPDSPTVLFWGINGATSVCASVLAVSISMGWGISSAFWAGWLCYGVATAALAVIILRIRG